MKSRRVAELSQQSSADQSEKGFFNALHDQLNNGSPLTAAAFARAARTRVSQLGVFKLQKLSIVAVKAAEASFTLSRKQG